eukprot:TRINITY_DN2914_c0_g1_i1.p1 TRINITY_DN2914_c0_g1~~TRINITY_DN2914_c0_g1_i1.p1  ORF type:complete len:675 (+),score=192.38 TRINITY_DN2914_c0_g1_i1:82-2025(+)
MELDTGLPSPSSCSLARASSAEFRSAASPSLPPGAGSPFLPTSPCSQGTSKQVAGCCASCAEQLKHLVGWMAASTREPARLSSALPRACERLNCCELEADILWLIEDVRRAADSRVAVQEASEITARETRNVAELLSAESRRCVELEQRAVAAEARAEEAERALCSTRTDLTDVQLRCSAALEAAAREQLRATPPSYPAQPPDGSSAELQAEVDSLRESLHAAEREADTARAETRAMAASSPRAGADSELDELRAEVRALHRGLEEAAAENSSLRAELRSSRGPGQVDAAAEQSKQRQLVRLRELQAENEGLRAALQSTLADPKADGSDRPFARELSATREPSGSLASCAPPPSLYTAQYFPATPADGGLDPSPPAAVPRSLSPLPRVAGVPAKRRDPSPLSVNMTPPRRAGRKAGALGLELCRSTLTVEKVATGGAAHRAGLRPGDRIETVRPRGERLREITSAADFRYAVSMANGVYAGSTVEIGYARTSALDGRYGTAIVKLTSGADTARMTCSKHLETLRHLAPLWRDLNVGLVSHLVTDAGAFDAALLAHARSHHRDGRVALQSFADVATSFADTRLGAPGLLDGPATAAWAKVVGAANRTALLDDLLPALRDEFLNAVLDAERRLQTDRPPRWRERRSRGY